MEQKDHLSKKDWLKIQDRFSGYTQALARKLALETIKVTFDPTSGLDKLGEERISAVLNSGLLESFQNLAAQDARVPAASRDIADLERLVLYYHHLYRLLRNFASFHDFYALRHDAIFQAGTLYIDGRSCQLCLPVEDVAKHSVLANYSQIYLLYCQCQRRQEEGSNEPSGTMNIVAAVTQTQALACWGAHNRHPAKRAGRLVVVYAKR